MIELVRLVVKNMRTASSIRYGGMLVESSECDYNSFKHLGLLCPICKRSVFLVKETTRSATERKLKDGSTTQVKGSNVSSYFAHHPEVDKNIVNDCELRSSQITSTQRLLAHTVARNQRQKILKCHITKMLKSSPALAYMENYRFIVEGSWKSQHIGNNRKAMFELNELIMAIIKNITTVSDATTHNVIEKSFIYFNRMSETISQLSDEEIIKFDLRGNDKEVFNHVKKWFGEVESSMQKKISFEVWEFLKNSKKKQLLENLIYVSVHHVIGKRLHNQGIKNNSDETWMLTFMSEIRTLIGMTKSELNEFSGWVLFEACYLIISVDWAEQFESAEHKELNFQGVGFG